MTPIYTLVLYLLIVALTVSAFFWRGRHRTGDAVQMERRIKKG